MKQASSTQFSRVAFSPGEFAALFGKSQTWGYRQIYAGKVKTITEVGRILIPAAEVERVLGKAEIYNGLKPKVEKRGKKTDAWQKFINARRGVKVVEEEAPSPNETKRKRSARTDARKAALARLLGKRERG